jgi:hypothetical protein
MRIFDCFLLQSTVSTCLHSPFCVSKQVRVNVHSSEVSGVRDLANLVQEKLHIQYFDEPRLSGQVRARVCVFPVAIHFVASQEIG